MFKTLSARIQILPVVLILSAPLAAAAQDAAQVKKGQEVYTAQKCSLCHAIGGKGNKVSVLDGVGKKLSAEEIRQWIVNPTEMTAKTKSTKKPPMLAKYGKLPQADLDALVTYLPEVARRGPRRHDPLERL